MHSPLKPEGLCQGSETLGEPKGTFGLAGGPETSWSLANQDANRGAIDAEGYRRGFVHARFSTLHLQQLSLPSASS